MHCSIRRRRVFAILAIAVASLFGLTGIAGAGEPTNQLKRHVDEVVKVLQSLELQKEQKAEERRAAVRKVAEQIFDFEETAKRSLGRHWQSRTPAERQEFVKLFTDLLEHAYVSKIDQYHGEKIAYLGDQLEGDQALVRTRIVTKGGAEVPVEYRMLKKGERWLVYDVVIEGVSLVANYRTQFNKIIQTSSYAELVKKMKVKQDEFIEASTKKS